MEGKQSNHGLGEKTMSKERCSMWVHPNFKKALKKKAAERGVPMLDFTEEFAQEFDMPQERKKRKDEFKFF